MIYFAILAGASLCTWGVAWGCTEIALREGARRRLAEALRLAHERIAALEALAALTPEGEEPQHEIFAVGDIVTVELTKLTKVVGKVVGATNEAILVQIGVAHVAVDPDFIEHHGAPTPGYRESAKGWN